MAMNDGKEEQHIFLAKVHFSYEMYCSSVLVKRMLLSCKFRAWLSTEWKDKLIMKLFDRKRRSFSTVFGVGLLMLLLVACGNSSTTTTTTSTAPVNGKGCTKVGILLPETASSFRWDGVDRPDLIKDITAALPAGSPAPDYNNAGRSASVQHSHAQADLTKGDCMLVV